MAGPQTAIATFNGAQPASGDYFYVDVTWGTAFASAAAYRIAIGTVVTSTVGIPVIILGNKVAASVRVLTTDQFSGTVELIGYPL